MDAIETVLKRSPGEAEPAIRSALAEQGFGILTEIDVAAVFKEKLGVVRPFLKILGACNPGFAERALQIDPSVSLLLPCNVVIEAVPAGTRVAAVDPLALMADPAFHALASEVTGKLRAAIDSVSDDKTTHTAPTVKEIRNE